MPKAVHTLCIRADVQSVWRAITDPDEVLKWDRGVVGWEGVMDDYPTPGKTYFWNYAYNDTVATLVDQPTAVDAPNMFSTRIQLAKIEFTEVFSLSVERGVTRLCIEMTLQSTDSNGDEAGLLQFAKSSLESTARALTRWCESRQCKPQ